MAKIIKQEYDAKVDVEKLIWHPKNSRKGAAEPIRESIEANGFFGAVTVQKSTGHVITGNHRWREAKELGMKEIPVIWADVTDEEAQRMMNADNRTSDLATYDERLLADQLLELEASELGLLGTGYSDEDLAELVHSLDERTFHFDPDEVPEVKSTEIKLGDLFELGDHRVLCGDSTKIENVERLMNGQKADMVFTDPPYGINLDTDYRALSNAEGRSNNYRPIIGDDSEWAFNSVPTIDCPEQFWWGADYYRKSLSADGSWFVWDKRESAASGKNVDGRIGSMFELCWSKKKHRRDIVRIMWAGMMGVKDDSKRIHPTQKPVQLAEWFINKFSESLTLVLDLFLGSGSTLIACEQLNRKCYGMEIDPLYVQVILDRWEKFTNKKAVKL